MSPFLKRSSLARWLAAAAVYASAHASIVNIDLVVPQLVLKDGTHYANLKFKTYDPAIGRVMALDGKTFITLASDALPQDLLKKLNAMVPPSAFQPEKPTTVVPVPYTPPKEEERATKEKKNEAEPAEAQIERDLKDGKAVALARAQNYFRSERSVGSGHTSITSLRFEWDDGEPVQGWARRYRFSGKAFYDYYDSYGGGNFEHGSQSFSVIVEANPHGTLKAVDISTLSN